MKLKTRPKTTHSSGNLPLFANWNW